MTKEELEFVIKNYKKGGTKEACVKVREFLRDACCNENTVISYCSCVSSKEFFEAVKILMAYAYEQKDEIPKRWNCDSDCKRVFDIFCPGECGIDKNSTNMCPFFIDEGNI